MRRILVLLLVTGLLVGGTTAIATAGDGGDRGTHTVLAEYGTATWCGYCKYAHGALKELYAEHNHDFYYVSLVTDKNPKANQRCQLDYNIYGYPTVYFDGGYKVNVGAGSVPSAKAAYNSSLTQCENRAVADIDVDVHVVWLGGTEMSICVDVKNNMTVPYRGHLRTYITEIESSMNWKDTGGHLYTFPFLDYAFNQDIQVAAGDTWGSCINWDGASHGYNTITYDNIMVIAGVFGSTPHQGYSYPPSGNPFTAYWVDEAAGAMPDSLSADTLAIPEAGGKVNFFLWGGHGNAHRNYLLMGSISGTVPGTPLPGGQATLPLNWDVFTTLVVNLVNTPIFSNFMGVLDTEGTAMATLNLPPVPGAAGLHMYYAYALNNPWDFASNPVDIEILP